MEHLRQVAHNIEGVVGRHPVHGLAQPITQSIVGISIYVCALLDRTQVVGVIIGIGARTVIKQITVVIPYERYAIHLDQPVGDVIDVGVGFLVSLLCQSITNSIVGIVEELTGVIIGSRQAVEGAVGVCDHTIRQQVAVVIPGIRHPTHVDQSAGDVVDIGVGFLVRLLRQTITHSIVVIVEELAGVIIGSRMRRIGIVAVARKILVALWRYLETGEIPEGVALKPLTI